MRLICRRLPTFSRSDDDTIASLAAATDTRATSAARQVLTTRVDRLLPGQDGRWSGLELCTAAPTRDDFRTTSSVTGCPPCAAGSSSPDRMPAGPSNYPEVGEMSCAGSIPVRLLIVEGVRRFGAEGVARLLGLFSTGQLLTLAVELDGLRRSDCSSDVGRVRRGRADERLRPGRE